MAVIKQNIGTKANTLIDIPVSVYPVPDPSQAVKKKN